MIWFGFVSLFMGFAVNGICYPTNGCSNYQSLPAGVGLTSGPFSSGASSVQYDCVNDDQRHRGYAGDDCSGDAVYTYTILAANLSAPCGECTSYFKIAGALYNTSDCSGTSPGSQGVSFGKALGFGCDSGVSIQCNDGNTVVIQSYTNDDCTGDVDQTNTWKEDSCGWSPNGNGPYMKFTLVECSNKGHKMALNWWFMVVIVLLLFK
eukprot:24504_1